MHDTTSTAGPLSYSQSCDTFRPRRAVLRTARRTGLGRTAFVHFLRRGSVRNRFVAELVPEGRIRHLGMQLGNMPLVLSRTLRLRQSFGGMPARAVIGELLAGRERLEVLQTKIDADASLNRACRHISNLYHDVEKPVPARRGGVHISTSHRFLSVGTAADELFHMQLSNAGIETGSIAAQNLSCLPGSLQ